MISKQLQDIINNQIQAEMYSAYLYLSMAQYFEDKNLAGFANWMRVQFEEEQAHAFKFIDYMNERGGRVVLAPIEAPKSDWKNEVEIFEDTLEHEKLVTSLLNKIADLADEQRDRPTQSLMTWYLDEQVEEEGNAEKLLAQLKLIDGNGNGLIAMDRELQTRVFTPIV